MQLAFSHLLKIFLTYYIKHKHLPLEARECGLFALREVESFIFSNPHVHSYCTSVSNPKVNLKGMFSYIYSVKIKTTNYLL